MDIIANSLNAIKVAELKGLPSARLKPASKLLREVLTIMQSSGYIGSFDYVDDGTSGEFTVKLIGKINKCGAIKPRFPVKMNAWEKYELRYLPSKEIGIIIVSTSKGLMTHAEAKEKKLGGRVVCYVY